MYKKLEKSSECMFEARKVCRDKVRVCDIQLGEDEWDKPYADVDESFYVQRNGEILFKMGNNYYPAKTYYNVGALRGFKCPYKNRVVVAFGDKDSIRFERVDILVYSAFGDISKWNEFNHIHHIDKNPFNCDIKNLSGLRHNKKNITGSVYSIDKDGNRVDYANIEDAIDKTNCSIATIYRALRKKNRTKNGFCFYWGEK